MPLPVPTGGVVAGAIDAITTPLKSALADVGKAMGAVLEAARALAPVLDTIGAKFKELGERFKVLFRDNIGIPLMDAVKAIGRGIKFALPTDVLDYFSKAANATTTAVGAVSKAISSLTIAAPVAATAIAAMGLAMVGLVAKANPIVAEQFTLALNDTLAVLGQMLMPVLQVVTQLMRMFGDALASFSKDMGGALGEIASAFLPVFEALFEVFARVMGLVADVLKFVAPVIRVIMDGIMTVFGWIAKAVRFLLGLIGIEFGESPVKKGSSVGAAARQASTTDVESVLRKARENALSLGTGAGPNYAEMTAKNTSDMIVQMGSIADQVVKIVNALSNPFGFADNIGEIIKTGVEAAQWEKDAAPGGFYHPDEFKKRLAARSPEDKAADDKFFSPEGFASRARKKAGDGGGTVGSGGAPGAVGG